jgi:osmotically inducible lipoprotein OsmB
MRRKRVALVGMVLAAALATTACTENSGKGAAIGAAAGAGVGLLNGGIIRNTATGAILGGAGGYIYDQVKDD